MVNEYITENLIADTKRRGSLPTSQELFTDSDFLDFLNDTLRIKLTPAIMDTQEEHFVYSHDISLVPGQNKYTLPPRAIGSKLRRVEIVDSSSQGTAVPRLDPTAQNPAPDYRDVFGYYFQNASLILTPTPSASEDRTLRLYYYRRPNKLVLSTDCAQITAINSVTGELTVASVPASWSTSDGFDIISNKSPFISHADSLTASSVGGGSLIFTPSLISDVEVGDWICIETQSPLPQIPADTHPILGFVALIDILRANGDFNQADRIAADLAQMEQDIFSMIESRDDGSPKRVNTQRGIFGYDKSRWWWW